MIKVNILLETFEKYLQLNYDRSKQQSKARHLPYTKKWTTEALTVKKLVPCFLFWGKFNFYTTWVEVKSRLLCKLRRSDSWLRHNLCRSWLLTSVQLGQKWGFRLLTNLVGSGFWKFCPSWTELFLPVDISLENVLTGRENFLISVEIRLLKFRI